MTEKNRIYESMTRVRHYDCVVRVWVTETAIQFGPRSDVERAIVALTNPGHPDGGSLALSLAIAGVLDTFPNVSAYEILDERGNGAIVYPDWK